MGCWPRHPTEMSEGNGEGHCPAWLLGTVAVPGGPEGWRRDGADLPRCQEGARRPSGRGPRLARGCRGGRGCRCVKRGSVGLVQVAAFRALGELSPHPSVTPCPPSQRPVLSPRRLELRGASWGPGRVRSGSRGGQEGAPQSKRAVRLTCQPGLLGPRGPRVWRRPSHRLSRCLGLLQGLGRLEVYLPPLLPPARPPCKQPD